MNKRICTSTAVARGDLTVFNWLVAALLVCWIASMMTACSQRTTIDSQPVQGYVLDSEISSFVHNLPPLREEHYLAPQKKWLEQIATVAVAESTRARQNYPWWDCDNFAMNMVVVASRETRNVHYDLAIGIAYGHRLTADALGFVGTPGYHAVNVVRCADGNWYYLEPQTGYIISVAEAREVFVADQILF